ncbi:MAG: glycosyltransferase family 39 protein [Anaerolineales bacterium]|nr:glycosyltransferase family 39 protein [Anaerolineales bacterium]
MSKHFPLKIYLIALAFRLIPILLTRNLGIGLDDMFQYDMLARSIASGHGFRWYAQADLKQLEPYVDFDLSSAKGYDPQLGLYTSFRAPLYPTFLALVYFLTGTEFSRFFFARLAQAVLLGAPLAPLTYFTARELFSGFEREKIARLSAWVSAGYPMLLVYPLGLGTENLFFVLWLAAIWALLKFSKQPTLRYAVLSGALLALTALTRSVILLFVGCALLYLFYLYRKPALWLALAFLAGVTPWALRNTLLHHKLTGIETSMGYNLYLGYHPQGNGSFIFGPSLDLLTIMDDAQRDEIGTQKALEFIRQAPQRFVPLALNRLGFFFGLEKRVLIYFYSNNLLGYIPPPVLLSIAFILLFPFVALMIYAIFGILALQHNRQSALLLLALICYLLPHIFILAEDRFHLALIPYLAILASYGFVLISSRQLNFNKRKLALAAVLIGLLAFNWGAELHRDRAKISTILSPVGNTAGFPY